MRNLLFILLFLYAGVFAQSGRTATASETPKTDTSVKELFTDASGYAKRKFTEYEAKKIPYTDNLYQVTVREQKQLAAKYAAIARTRQTLAGEDFYFLGMLDWTAENADAAAESLKKFLTVENADGAKMQTARPIISVAAARRKDFDEAEMMLADYLKNAPVKASERSLAERELADAYRANKDYVKAAAHAEEAYRAAKNMFTETASRFRGLNQILDAGLKTFEIYADDSRQNEADRTLEDLRRTALLIGSIEIYYAAIDANIKYLIETKRKSLALKTYDDALKQTPKDFTDKPQQDDVIRRLKNREKQYRILGEQAPEIKDVDAWFPGTPQTFANLRGKVVLIDFWATWCAPCIAAFPALSEMQQTYKNEGFVLLGLTRYYDKDQRQNVDNSQELARLKNFRVEKNLPYDFVVTDSSASLNAYAVPGLPTTVLVDRKGIIRYAETGTSRSREEDLRRLVEKLLAEK